MYAKISARMVPPEAGKRWYMAAHLKKPAYGVNDAPRKWWNRLDAAVENMGLCPARTYRCTYASYSDVKKHKKTRMAHSTDANEDASSIGDSTPPLHEDTYSRMYHEIIHGE